MPPPPSRPILKVKLTTPSGVTHVEYVMDRAYRGAPWSWQYKGLTGQKLGDFEYGCRMTVDDARIVYDGREDPLWSGTLMTTAPDGVDFKRTHTVKTTGGGLVAYVVLNKTARGNKKVKHVDFDIKSHPFMSEHQNVFEAHELEQSRAAEEAKEADRRKREREESDEFWEMAKGCVDRIEALANGPAKRLMAERERGGLAWTSFNEVIGGINDLHWFANNPPAKR